MQDQIENMDIQEKFNILFEHIGSVELWMVRDKILFITPNIFELTGYTAEECISDIDLHIKMTHPDDLADYKKYLSQVYKGLILPEVIRRIIRKDGKVLWVFNKAVRIYDKEGNYIGVRNSTFDITRQKELELQILRDKEHYLSMLEHQTDLILQHLPDDSISYVNPALVEFFSAKREELLGKNWRSFLTKGELEKIDHFYNNTDKKQPLKKMVFDHICADGSVRYVEWIEQAFFDNDGELLEKLLIGRDITESIEKNSQLKIAKARYKALVEEQRDIVLRYTPDHIITYTNKAASDFIGIEPEKIIGTKWTDYVDLMVAEKAFKSLTTLSPSTPIVNAEYQLTRFDGEKRWFLVMATTVLDENNKIIEHQTVGRDITERKLAQEKLDEAHKEIEDLKQKLEQENLYLRKKFIVDKEHSKVSSQSPSMKEVLNKIKQVSKTEAPVLIYGATGTGKEVIAQKIHNMSSRSKRLMITVNCGALPLALIESELFGREKGAYTGALSSQIGRFELADGSTIFLDEIGELPLETQVKLLRVLQFGEFQMLGSPHTRKVDVRIIAATNRDLTKALADGRFRSDLYYRLNVFPITLPALKDRREDIPGLVWEFVDEIGHRMGKRIEKITPESMNRLLAHNWPGNIRELRNVVEYSMILATGPILEIVLQEHIGEKEFITDLEAQQKSHIEEILNMTNWRIRGAGGAAELLGMKESTLRFRMKKLGIERSSM
ncbi:MAG: sigma 54-interacting transcriptional regulator [Bacteroidales bacterium]